MHAHGLIQCGYIIAISNAHGLISIWYSAVSYFLLELMAISFVYSGMESPHTGSVSSTEGRCRRVSKLMAGCLYLTFL